MKKIIFTLLLCILISACGIYRSKYFVPIDYFKDYRGGAPTFKIDRFENWDILIDFSAYYGIAGLSPESINKNHFGIDVTATTYDKELFKRQDTKYKANIKYIKIFYGEKLQNEIKISETKYSISDDGKFVLFGNADTATIYVPPDVKSVTIISEIEFLDKENNSTVKKFIIPMKRKEESSIWMLMD